MSTDLLIEAIERLEAATETAREVTRECHAAQKDLRATQKEVESWLKDARAHLQSEADDLVVDLFTAAWVKFEAECSENFRLALREMVKGGDRLIADMIQRHDAQAEVVLREIASR